MVRMVNSGTEAAMSAIRLARGATGRNLIVKFDGCYHGHGDSLLVAAGSGVATLSIAGSAGVPAGFIEQTLSLPYNDISTFEQVMNEKGEQIAAVIVEPVAGNMGVILPEYGFLESLRSLCDKTGSLLIFDEVITGFRLAYGGAQSVYGIKPDLTCLGKIIGGGLPVGAYGGRKDLMQQIAPSGPVYQAGTLSGNPLAMAAGIATLSELAKPGFYETLDASAERLFRGVTCAAEQADIPLTAARAGSLMGFFFAEGPIRNFNDAQKSNLSRFSRFFKAMLLNGIYLAPSQYEAWFVSAAHDEYAIDATVRAAEAAFSEMTGKDLK
jgi:glutamate-1-semialdehyde 2,1-aminomutase